jgi:hypothetical protein
MNYYAAGRDELTPGRSELRERQIESKYVSAGSKVAKPERKK